MTQQRDPSAEDARHSGDHAQHGPLAGRTPGTSGTRTWAAIELARRIQAIWPDRHTATPEAAKPVGGAEFGTDDRPEPDREAEP